MLADKQVWTVELSALRQDELPPLVEQLGQLELGRFKYISFHAPSSMDRSFEPIALDLLGQVASRGWPIIVHPDAMWTPSKWRSLGDNLCIENMDKRKPMGQTARDLSDILKSLPNASLCFDIGHARQVDPTMSEASAILRVFRGRIKQLHVSEVNTQSKHDCLSLESILAFQKVAHLVPAETPVILESKVEESGIEEEIKNALTALNTEGTETIPFGYGLFTFDESGIGSLVESGGVYGLAKPSAYTLGPYTILYVGKTGNLRERLRAHLNDPPVSGITHFFAEPIAGDAARTEREYALLQEFKLAGNMLLSQI